MRKARVGLFVLLALLSLQSVWAQNPAQAPSASGSDSPKADSPKTDSPKADSRKTSEPYTGDLSIFDSAGRDDRLQINRVMDILAVAPGKAVADVGAGSGWFTVRAARRVGASGVVY